MDLETLKNKIEGLNKNHHIEILKIVKQTPNIRINENKSGIFINMAVLPKPVLEEIEKYLFYVDAQENTLTTIETEKESFKNTFFVEKDEHEISSSMYSYQV